MLDRIPPGRPVSFETEVLPAVLPDGVYGFRLTGFWEDAGTPDRLLRAQRLLFDAGRGGRASLPVGAIGRGPVALEGRATVTGATFGPYVTLGDGVTVGPGAHVENSVVMAGATVEPGASVVGSIVGPGAHIARGHRVHRQVVGERADG